MEAKSSRWCMFQTEQSAYFARGVAGHDRRACAATPTQESTGGYIDDATITAKIKSDLALDSKVSALDIHVKSYKGVVELSGFVDSAEQIPEAGKLASQVDGVKSVHNDLIVKGAVAPPNAVEKRAE